MVEVDVGWDNAVGERTGMAGLMGEEGEGIMWEGGLLGRV